jgi:hypothetical protein
MPHAGFEAKRGLRYRQVVAGVENANQRVVPLTALRAFIQVGPQGFGLRLPVVKHDEALFIGVI